MKFTPNSTSGNVIDMYNYGGVKWDVHSYYSEKFRIRANISASATPYYESRFVMLPYQAGGGKIGLGGIESPTETVHIAAGATGTSTGSFNDVRLFVEGDISGSVTSTGSFGAISVKNGGTPQIFGNSTGIGIKQPTPLFPLHVEGTSRLNGNVGIGIAPGSYALDVYGIISAWTKVQAPFFTNNSVSTNTIIKASNTGLGVSIQNASAQVIAFFDGATNSPKLSIGHGSPTRRLHVYNASTDNTPDAEFSGSTDNGGSILLTSKNYPGIKFGARGRIWYDGSMTIDNNGDGARPIKITTLQGTAASGKTGAIIRIAPSGSTSGYFNAHGGVSLGRNHSRADSSTSTDFILHMSASADHGLLTLKDSSIVGSTTSTGSFGRFDSGGRSYFSKGMTVGTFSENASQLILSNRGTADYPAISWAGDENTGFWQSTDNKMEISINGNTIVGMDYYNFHIKSATALVVGNNASGFFKVGYDGNVSASADMWVGGDITGSGNLEIGGNIVPAADNSKDLGSSSYRWANLYVGDMELNNEGTEGNEIDGTTGKWTIQEGEDDLYLLNRKSGKKYRFKLEEIP